MNRLRFLGTTILGLFKSAQKQEPQEKYMKRVNDTLVELLDSNTGEYVTFSKVTTFADGTAMSDAKCDGVIYRKLGSEYFRRNFTGPVNVKWFGAKGDGVTDDTEAIQKANNTGFKLSFFDGIFLLTSPIEFLNTIKLENAILKSDTDVILNGLEADLKKCFDVSGSLLLRNVDKIIATWFGADGLGKACGGSVSSGSNTVNVTGYNMFVPGDDIIVKGAGVVGTDLKSIVTGVTLNTITIADNASVSVSIVPVFNQNDSINLNRFFDSIKKTIDASSPNTNGIYGTCTGYIPRGVYCCVDSINIYSGCKIQGEYSNVLGGVILLQCDISNPLINMVADNTNNDNISVGGNGNNIIKDISFKSAYINDNFDNAPVINFQPAFNVHSDTEFDHCLFQNTAGFCFQAGFSTTGSAIAGTNNLTLGNGSVFRSNGDDIGGSRIIIKGAGLAGGDLSTYIVSGGGTNNVLLAQNILTTVVDAVVYPVKETINPLKINNCEFDIVRGGFKFTGNTNGMLILNHMQVFQSVRGFVYIDSHDEWFVKLNDSLLEGCGNSYNSNAEYSHAFFIKKRGANGGKIHINNIELLTLDGFRGNIHCENLEKVYIKNNILTDLDHSGLAKFFMLINNKIVNISNNDFESKSLVEYSNSRLISFSNSEGHVLNVVNDNVFININNEHSFENFIHSDYQLSDASFKNNTYIGNVNNVANSNIANSVVRNDFEDNTITKKSDNQPVLGVWKKGDRIINSNPTIGQPKSWVCTFPGSPGTWVSEGNL